MAGSESEINQLGGMDFGGMPRNEVLFKLEETDPALVDGVRGYDPMRDRALDYDDYVRGEIVDWAPDDTYLESDHTRRDKTLSRTIINLRYNGGRGPNDYRAPQHPELFLGFTGNDPRGRDNQPRFDKLRGHTVARARNHEVRMGQNIGHGGPSGFQLAERPWGGVAQSYDIQEANRRLKGYYQWFDTSIEGRPWGRNYVADDVHGTRRRQMVADDGTEGMFVHEQDQPRFASGVREQVSDFAPAIGAAAPRAHRSAVATVRGLGNNRNVMNGGDFAAEHYAVGRGGMPQLTNESRALQVVADRDFGGSMNVAARRSLAVGMSAAAAQQRADVRMTPGDGETGEVAYGTAQEARGGSGAQTANHRRDIAAAARAAVVDSSMLGVAVESSGTGAARGLRAGTDLGRLQQHAVSGQLATPNATLGAAECVVRALREGTAASRRGVLNAVVNTQMFGDDRSGPNPGRGQRPGDSRTAVDSTHLDIMRSLEATRTHTNRSYAPGALHPASYVNAAIPGGFESERAISRLAYETTTLGASAGLESAHRGGVGSMGRPQDDIGRNLGGVQATGNGRGMAIVGGSMSGGLRADTGGQNDPFGDPFDSVE